MYSPRCLARVRLTGLAKRKPCYAREENRLQIVHAGYVKKKPYRMKIYTEFSLAS